MGDTSSSAFACQEDMACSLLVTQPQTVDDPPHNARNTAPTAERNPGQEAAFLCWGHRYLREAPGSSQGEERRLSRSGSIPSCCAATKQPLFNVSTILLNGCSVFLVGISCYTLCAGRRTELPERGADCFEVRCAWLRPPRVVRLTRPQSPLQRVQTRLRHDTSSLREHQR